MPLLQSVRFKEPVAGPGKGSSTSQGYYSGEPPPGTSINAYTWLRSIEMTKDEIVLVDKRGRTRRSPLANLIEYERVGDHHTDDERKTTSKEIAP